MRTSVRMAMNQSRGVRRLDDESAEAVEEGGIYRRGIRRARKGRNDSSAGSRVIE